jgi:hypothetical protein
MSSIVLIDTTIFTELLDVPYFNEHREKVLQDYEIYVEFDCTLLLPMATIIETGNHIAQNGDGRKRREIALDFIKQVKATFKGDAPWMPSQFPQIEEILLWIDQFPDLAGQGKIGKRKNKERPEGTSFGDLSIIQEYEKACARSPMKEVFIWSLDSDLKMYYRPAK